MSRARLALLRATLVAFTVACQDFSSPAAPPPAAPPATPFPPVLPEIRGPGTTYLEKTSIYSRFGYVSRFILYTDGTFALQFTGRGPPLEYAGHYTRTDSEVTFDFYWKPWSISPAAATASLRGDEMVVSYTEAMGWNDFIGGAYVHASETP
jgi:hypothetical protein